MDPKKKNIILISVAVLAMGYAGYSLLFSGSSSNAQTQAGTFKKKEVKRVVGLQKKATLVKKVAKDRQKNTLKKKRGKRGGRKTKKQEVAPAA